MDTLFIIDTDVTLMKYKGLYRVIAGIFALFPLGFYYMICYLIVNKLEGMLGYQIAEQISKFGPVYDSLSGIVSIDQIPKTIGLYKYIVSNLSTSQDPGVHWIVSTFVYNK